MILWFGRKKKLEEMRAAGRALAQAEHERPEGDEPPPEAAGSPAASAVQEEAVPASAEEAIAAEHRDAGLFARLGKSLARSTARLAEGISALGRRKLDETTLEELQDLLITADMGTRVAARITRALSKERFEREVSDEDIRLCLAHEIEEILAPREKLVDFAGGPRPRIVLFVGVNGSGKTTTIGKIASRLGNQGARAVLVAGDTFRAAAAQQLRVWGERSSIPVISGADGADPAGLVYSAVEKAKAEDLDLVLIDTAGRLQNKSELMSELSKIVRVVRKLDPDAPHDVILVLDATVGQNALRQVEAFREAAGVTGLVMTKLDGTAKGGVLVAIAEAHDLPIHFIGIGEGADDLRPFSAPAFARALVGLTR